MVLRAALDYRPAVLGGSGIGRAVRELAGALARSGEIELHLFAHSLAPPRREVPDLAGARLHRAPIPGRSLPWLARAGLDAAALAGRVPLFHWTDYVHPPVRRAAAVLTVHDCAFAADERWHGTQSGELLARSRRAAAQAARVVVPSEATRADVITHLGVPDSKIAVIPFGADHLAPAPAPRPLAEPYVLCVGTIEPRKNHLAMLRAWERLDAPLQLVVAGRRGWECANVVAALRDAVRSGVAVWHEDVADEELGALLQHAELLVYPSSLEGFGFPPLEAFAAGVPVVAGDTPALREVLDDAARFCTPNEPAAIAAAVREVLGDGKLRRTLVDRGRKRAACFRWSRCADRHLEIYREVLADAASKDGT